MKKKIQEIKRQLINIQKIKFLPNPLSSYLLYFSARSMNQNTFKTFYTKKKTLNCVAGTLLQLRKKKKTIYTFFYYHLFGFIFGKNLCHIRKMKSNKSFIGKCKAKLPKAIKSFLWFSFQLFFYLSTHCIQIFSLRI